MSIIKSPPCYSMNGKAKFQKDLVNVPGPGSYKEDSKILNKKFPNYSIGNSRRKPINEMHETPAPNAYSSSLKFLKKAPEYIILSKHETENKQNISFPGPDHYNPNSEKVKKKVSYPYSFRMRNTSMPELRSHLPGPGNYDIHNPVLDVSQTTSFGNEKRSGILTKQNSEIPAVGQYSPQLLRMENPKYKFGKEMRQSNYYKNNYPSPGSYNHKLFVGQEGNKYTLIRRPNSSPRNKGPLSPGPAAYTIKMKPKDNENHGFKFANAGKLVIEKKQIIPGPGPSEYNNDKKTKLLITAPSWKIGTSMRSSLETISNIGGPGPGSYQIKSKILEGPKHSLRPKLNFSKDGTIFPGPGSYSPKMLNENPRKCGFGYGKKEFIDLREIKNLSAAVGQYSERYIGKKSPNYSFGSSTRIDKLKNINPGPGPGYYDSYNTIGHLPKYVQISFHSKNSHN